MAGNSPIPAAATSTSTAGVRTTLLGRLIAFDTALSLHIHSLCSPIPRCLLKVLEISGDGRFWFPIPIALLTFTRNGGGGSSTFEASDQLLCGLLLGSLLDLLLVGLVKHLVRRPRPVYNKGMSIAFAVDHWSFPSGHSSRVFFIAAFLLLNANPLRRVLVDGGPLAPARQWIKRWYGGNPAELLLWFVPFWSVSTSASRVLLGRHFVLDVLAGACLGVFEALFVFYLISIYMFA